jgi:hypothetical protein
MQRPRIPLPAESAGFSGRSIPKSGERIFVTSPQSSTKLQFITNPLKTIMTIKSIFARSIYDSRGNPTVEVDLITGMTPFG